MSDIDKPLAIVTEALRAAKTKLERYREVHGGEYVGGVEYAALMARIDTALRAGDGMPDGKVPGGKG